MPCLPRPAPFPFRRLAEYTALLPPRRLQIHWFSIFNSFMMVIFLVALVVLILFRTLNRDFARYEQLETSGDVRVRHRAREVTGTPAHRFNSIRL